MEAFVRTGADDMMDELERIAHERPIAVSLGGAALVVFLGLIDYLTGAELSCSILYLARISLVTIMVGRTAGMVPSLTSAVVSLLGDLGASATCSNPLIAFRNAAVGLGYFAPNTTFALGIPGSDRCLCRSAGSARGGAIRAR